MPNQLVIVAEELLRTAGDEAPDGFQAVAHLAHTGHPVAVVLARRDDDAAVRLQQLAGDAGGQVVAFFQRRGDRDLAPVLREAAERWRIEPAQVYSVFVTAEDLAAASRAGTRAIVLESHLGDEDLGEVSPTKYANLGALVEALLETQEPSA